MKKDEKVWTNQFGCGKGSVIFSLCDYKINSQHVDNNGRYIVLNLLIDGSPVILVNYYVPNYEADQVKLLSGLTHVFDKLEITANTRFLWGGDFNTIFDISLDADGVGVSSTLAKLSSMMSENYLCDIFRTRHPDSRRFTW